ncbi:MAG TPA: FUSC family protein [Ktedonobacterales bacterium]|nr:FUSC family protein [Ktedonobacterales bacterium]
MNGLRDAWSSRSPALLFAFKSALAAGISWEITNLLLGGEAASLAMISAVIVVQVTSWQTARKGIERLFGVLIGVVLAFVVAHFLGLNLWTISLIILCAQIIGMFLQRRGPYLATQIPISAALALVLGATVSEYSLLRLLGALIGGVVGTAISLLISPPVYIFRARDAVADLMTQVAAAIPRLANALAGNLNEAETRETYTSIRALEQRVRATEQAYSLGIDSARLNPWALRARQMLVDYPDVLLSLDRLVRQMRRIAFTLNEPESSWREVAQTREWARDYARLLEDIGSDLAVAAESMRVPTMSGDKLPAGDTIGARIEHAQQQFRAWQAQLARDTLNPDTSIASSGRAIMVRGAILTDLRRMLDEVQDIIELTTRPPAE